jgi:predicted ferric reductase
MRTIKQEHYFPFIMGWLIVFWAIDLSLYKGSYEYSIQKVVGEMLSSWVITVLAINFLMATRAKVIERIFGGLDKMYMVHRRAGIFAVAFLILHFIVIPKSPEFAIGKPMGLLALVLILIGVIISAAPVFKRKIKYHKWINFHKSMGLFYVIGIAHSFNVSTLTSELPIVRTYVYGWAFIGIVAWIYRAFLYNIFNKKLDYTVQTIKHFADDTMEILLAPDTKKLAFDAGQFAFVAYDGINGNEPHPFTISNHPGDDHLRFTVKALGDYTADLQTSLKNGTKAKVQGAFGQFDFKKGQHRKQLWLAGGIGITPFLSFLREVDTDYSVMLVWSIKSIDQANYKNEIESIVAQKNNIDFVLWDSDSKGRFSIDKKYKSATIKNHSIFICGPEVMRESYIKQLLEKGVSIQDIHYEEFSFR